MKKLTKEQALEKIEQLKKYVSEKEQEEKGFVIKNWKDGSEIYVSKADNVREAVIEAVENGAELREANLYGAELSGAELHGAEFYKANLCEAKFYGAELRGADLHGAKFYGKGGTVKLKKNQVEHFLNALGFMVED